MSETTRAEAERVAERFLPYLLRVDRGEKLIDAIDRALQARDKRAAKIADGLAKEYGDLADRYWREGDRNNAAIRQGWATSAQNIAASIRKDTP